MSLNLRSDQTMMIATTFPKHLAKMLILLFAFCSWSQTRAQSRDLSFRHLVIDANGPPDPWVKIVGDLNGDGHADVVIGGRKGPVVWYAWPKWTKAVIGPGVTGVVDGEVGDVDGDGDLDVVMGGVVWYENPRPGSDPAKAAWKEHRIGRHPTHDLEVGDLDGDGDLDVVARGQSGFGAKTGNTIYLWRQDTPTSWAQRILDCPHGEGLTLGDLDGDGDGDLDIVIGGRWYENTKDILKGAWTEHVFASWHPDAVVKTGDFNGDGRLDVVATASEAPYHLSWFEAPSDPKNGPWKEHVIDGSVDFAHGIAVADMDRDGDLDVVTAEMHQSQRDRVLVYLNNGNGANWSRQVVAATGSHNVRVADFGNDGWMDIVGANWSGPYQPIEVWEQF
jgi:hypothetical protein